MSDRPRHLVQSVRKLTATTFVIRVDRPVDESILHKIAMFCNVEPDCVIENRTLGTLYEAPLMLEEHHFSDVVCRKLRVNAPAPDLSEWEAMLRRVEARSAHVKIALVGKYVKLHDAYLSVAEALKQRGDAALKQAGLGLRPGPLAQRHRAVRAGAEARHCADQCSGR